MIPTEAQLDAAAAAIANAALMRGGCPPIVNVLNALPANILEEVREEAAACLRTVGTVAAAGGPTACLHCGCTDGRACAGGCFWVWRDPPTCSACVLDALLFAAAGLDPSAQAHLVDALRRSADDVAAIAAAAGRRPRRGRP